MQYRHLTKNNPSSFAGFFALLLGAFLAFSCPGSAVAQSAETLDSLRAEIARIARIVESSGDSHTGWADKMHFHGYGELHFNFPKTGAMNDRADNIADFHRFVLGWGYEFTDKIRFDAEIDFEHNANEIELEYAQLEIDILPTLSFRAGSILMPVGSLNEVHEPPNFYSVERPNVHSLIIPTTWQENGVGLAGRSSNGAFAYRVYVVPGLDATGFSSKKGIRGGRTKGIKTVMNDFALTGRAEYSPLLPSGSGTLHFGSSFYFGQADQDDTALGEVKINILTGDIRYDVSGFRLQAEAIVVNLDGVSALSSALGETIGERMFGWYAEVGFDLFRHLSPNSEEKLVFFVRREQFDTNDRVPSGFADNPAADREIWTTGFAYYPIHKVALKSDIEFWKDGTGATVSRANAGFAFMF